MQIKNCENISQSNKNFRDTGFLRDGWKPEAHEFSLPKHKTTLTRKHIK